MNFLFKKYLDAILKKDKSSIIYTLFLDNQEKSYLENTTPKRMVIDFISGMTDGMFLHEISKKEDSIIKT